MCSIDNHAHWTDVLGEHQPALVRALRRARDRALPHPGHCARHCRQLSAQRRALATGQLEGTTIKCRAHGLRFDVSTGCPRAAGGFTVRTYPARVNDGRVEVDLGASAG